jgi:hypothetical protein
MMYAPYALATGNMRSYRLYFKLSSELLTMLKKNPLGGRQFAGFCDYMGAEHTIGVLGFDSRRELGIFFFNTASRTVLGPTQPPIQWVRGALYLGVKRPGREADHSPSSSAAVKECVELYLHSPNKSS